MMLSAIFFEKALYAILTLAGSLIVVIYKLFNGSLKKDFELQEKKLDEKFNKKFEALNLKINDLTNEMSSFKKHENNNYLQQNNLIKRLIKKLNIKLIRLIKIKYV